jgi:hypothetical protein
MSESWIKRLLIGADSPDLPSPPDLRPLYQRHIEGLHELKESLEWQKVHLTEDKELLLASTEKQVARLESEIGNIGVSLEAFAKALEVLENYHFDKSAEELMQGLMEAGAAEVIPEPVLSSPEELP